MRFAGVFGGPADPVVKTLSIGADVGAGVVCMHDTNHYGSVIACTTTSSTDALGLTLTAGTYTATPTASTEGTVDAVCNPFVWIEALCAGDGTSGTALSAATKHVMTQTSASKTVVTDTTNGYSNDRDSGVMIALTGANAGLVRTSDTHVDATSSTVTVAFPNYIAVGDKVVVLPYGPGTRKVQPTSDFKQADASIAIGTGIDCVVTDVKLQYPINSTNPEVFVYFILVDTIWNPID